MISLKHHLERLFAGLVLLLLASVAANAQSVTGSISGVVVDSNRGVIAGAKVTLISEQTKAPRDLSSSEDGRFSFAALQPGIYTIKIEHAGFQILLKQKVVLSANEGLALGEIAMKTGQVTETVTVTSEGQLVEKQSSDLQARLTGDQISLISTKGRDITSLLRLIPGTSNNDDIEAVGEGFGTDLPNFSGQRGRSAVATIDGLFAGEPSGSNKLSMTINQVRTNWTHDGSNVIRFTIATTVCVEVSALLEIAEAWEATATPEDIERAEEEFARLNREAVA